MAFPNYYQQPPKAYQPLGSNLQYQQPMMAAPMPQQQATWFQDFFREIDRDYLTPNEWVKLYLYRKQIQIQPATVEMFDMAQELERRAFARFLGLRPWMTGPNVFGWLRQQQILAQRALIQQQRQQQQQQQQRQQFRDWQNVPIEMGPVEAQEEQGQAPLPEANHQQFGAASLSPVLAPAFDGTVSPRDLEMQDAPVLVPEPEQVVESIEPADDIVENQDDVSSDLDSLFDSRSVTFGLSNDVGEGQPEAPADEALFDKLLAGETPPFLEDMLKEQDS